MSRLSYRLPVLFLVPLLLPMAAAAQTWPNDVGPAFDLQDNSWGQFWRLRQAQQQQQDAGIIPPAGVQQQSGRAPIPMLDWAPVPPPPVPERAAPRPRPRPAAQPQPQYQPQAAPQPVYEQPLVQQSRPNPQAAANIDAVERSLAERERQLEAMRRSLEDDRRRLEAARTALPR